MPIVSASNWDQFLASYPDAHLLQTSAWGRLKSSFGWEAIHLIHLVLEEHILSRQVDELPGAQILFRQLPLGFTVAYIPKGPVGTGGLAFWEEVDEICRQKRAIFVKVEPDQWLISPDNVRVAKAPPGFRPSQHTIQPPRTILVDLKDSEAQILNRMKQKTRYNIRLAAKKGVTVSASTKVDEFYRLMEITGSRDRFSYHTLDYYQQLYDLFHPAGDCELLIADYQGEMLAGLMVFARGSRAWYFYGASSNAHRERMPAYILQWEAMRWARGRGCTTYDLWGVPDVALESLETNFNTRSDGLWGVYRFKRGFGGLLCRAAGPWDRIYQPFWYAFYRWWIRRRQTEGI